MSILRTCNSKEAQFARDGHYLSVRFILSLLCAFFILSGSSLSAIELLKTFNLSGPLATSANFETTFNDALNGKMMVGAPFDGTTAIEAGRVDVIDIITGDTSLTMFGDVQSALFGSSVDFIRDFDGDGVVDYLIGSQGLTPSQTEPFGRAYVFSGATGDTALKTGSLGGYHNVGAGLGGAGDLNNDGLSDVVIGFPMETTCFPSLAGMLIYAGDTAYVDAFSFWGWDQDSDTASCYEKRIRYAGDLNNDGFDDVLYSYNSWGSMRILYGGDSATFSGSVFWSGEFGFDGVGDVNKDGFNDFIVGNRFFDQSRGKVAVVSGFDFDTLYYFEGEKVTDIYGETVAGCGDFDGDTYPDFVVGASYYASDTTFTFRPGKIYIYSGRDGHLLDTALGAIDGAGFGRGLEAAGDINMDGKSDIFVGERGRITVLGASNCCAVAGDFNDDGSFNIADVTAGVGWIFGGGESFICPEEADSNGDGSFNISDITYAIARIFSGGPAPVCPTI